MSFLFLPFSSLLFPFIELVFWLLVAKFLAFSVFSNVEFACTMFFFLVCFYLVLFVPQLLVPAWFVRMSYVCVSIVFGCFCLFVFVLRWVDCVCFPLVGEGSVRVRKNFHMWVCMYVRVSSFFFDPKVQHKPKLDWICKYYLCKNSCVPLSFLCFPLFPLFSFCIEYIIHVEIGGSFHQRFVFFFC